MLQKAIMTKFKEKHNGPTYKQMAILTGIEQTRLFRINNGSEMKLSEFERVLKLVSENSNPINLFLDCYRFLEGESINEVEKTIKRKLILAKMKKES